PPWTPRTACASRRSWRPPRPSSRRGEPASRHAPSRCRSPALRGCHACFHGTHHRRDPRRGARPAGPRHPRAGARRDAGRGAARRHPPRGPARRRGRGARRADRGAQRPRVAPRPGLRRPAARGDRPRPAGHRALLGGLHLQPRRRLPPRPRPHPGHRRHRRLQGVARRRPARDRGNGRLNGAARAGDPRPVPRTTGGTPCPGRTAAPIPPDHFRSGAARFMEREFTFILVISPFRLADPNKTCTSFTSSLCFRVSLGYEQDVFRTVMTPAHRAERGPCAAVPRTEAEGPPEEEDPVKASTRLAASAVAAAAAVALMPGTASADTTPLREETAAGAPYSGNWQVSTVGPLVFSVDFLGSRVTGTCESATLQGTVESNGEGELTAASLGACETSNGFSSPPTDLDL